MNFNKKDELFVHVALDKANRERSIQMLQKARNITFIPLIISMGISGTLLIVDVFSRRADMARVLGCVCAILLLMMSMQLDTVIKMLKLAGALQQKQTSFSTTTNS